MSSHRIFAIVLRHYYSIKHNIDRVTDIFYWPAIDMLVWGLTSTYLNSGPFKGYNIIVALVSALVFWIIAWRIPYEVAIGLLDDVWSKNLTNIFVSPLTFSEWVIALIIISGIKALLSFLWAAILALILYKVGILQFGLYIIPFISLLIFSGWTLGLFITALIFQYGVKVQAFAWTLGAIIMPFSAIYYPLHVLPSWAQTISAFIPTSYVFEGIRQLLYTKQIDYHMLLISSILNICYFILVIIFLKTTFKHALQKGLIKLF